MSSQEKPQTSSQNKQTYPSYLDLLTEEQFSAFEKGIRLARDRKNEEATNYFQGLIPTYEDQPYMLTAVCIVLADLDHVAEATEIMQRNFERYKSNGMFLCGLLRLALAEQNFQRFDELYQLVKQWLKENEPSSDKAEIPYQSRLENAIVFAEAAYLGVRYCVAQGILGQAAFLIKNYEEIMPDHDMHIALKLYLAQALQGVVKDFKLPQQEHEFEPFMDHVIAQIIEQNKENTQG
ncbi:hypothetical protein KJZ61_00325 [Candidatus Dependentiae bacterium]|nr:hypothetical protein [Candidatus Dependentiae bacterium]